MRISLIGVGMGNPDTLTLGALKAIEGAQLIIGAPRLLESLGYLYKGEAHKAIYPEEIKTIIDERQNLETAAVLMSGDLGFYSGANKLLPLLSGYEVETISGITTVSYLAAKLHRPWQDVKLVSAHGTDCNILAAVLSAKEVFFLTGGKISPRDIIDELNRADLGHAEVSVGANLSYPDEIIVTDKASALKNRDFPPLSALWVKREDYEESFSISTGLADESFIRGEVPMTKSEVRAAVISKLRPQKKDVIYDIGAGTGSVSIELARLSPEIRVFAVECLREGWELIEKNREKFSAYNLSLIKGMAPEAMENLPAPNCAFIGGSRGNMREIIESLLSKNPSVRIVISAIAAETLGQALASLKELGFKNIEISQISISRSKAVSDYHLMMGQNPVFLLSGEGRGV